MTHLEMFAEVLFMATKPLDRHSIVAALDARFPGWTGAKDYDGKLGIVSRVIYKAPEQYRGVFVEVLGDERKRWTLSDAAREAIRRRMLGRDQAE